MARITLEMAIFALEALLIMIALVVTAAAEHYSDNGKKSCKWTVIIISCIMAAVLLAQVFMI